MKRALLLILLSVIHLYIYSQNNWLSRIADETPIADIAIPGSHNSATGNKLESITRIGVTQLLTIDKQWEIGIRAFDLRPDICNEEINIYHGPLKARITFSQAIETILKKLENAPNEFAIIIIRQERFGDDAEKRQLWSDKIGKYIQSLGDRASIFHPEITAGEMRGKILFISRSHYTSCSKGAYIKGWSHSPTGTDNAKIVSYSKSEETPLLLQDFYAPVTNEKLKTKLSTILKFLQQKSQNRETKWSINYLSGYASTLFGINGIPTQKGYLRNATYIHKGVLEFLTDKKEKRCTGIIMMDFAGKEKIKGRLIFGEQIVKEIIESNFCPGK